jgi:glycosyltransferase involved in cell wall biosynthesis
MTSSPPGVLSLSGPRPESVANGYRDSTRISIVTPSYNQGKYIERTIQSVLSQEVRGLEYTVIDGGSADETILIQKRYEDRLLWISERDSGPSDAINKGFLRSKGPVLGWLNSDDIYYPGALKTVLEFFEQNPDVDVLYGDTYHINENDEVIERYPTEDWNWTRLHETCFISQPAAFFRRRVFDEYGPLEVGVRCMDYEYWLRLGKNGVRFEHLPRTLAATRLHKEAFTVAGRVAGHKEINGFTRKHLSRTPDKWLFNYAHAIAEAKGYNRSRPFSFISTLIVYSLYASFHWNNGVSPNMARIILAWIKEHLVPGPGRT